MKTILCFLALLAGGLIFKGDFCDLRWLDYAGFSGNVLIGSALVVLGLSALVRVEKPR